LFTYKYPYQLSSDSMLVAPSTVPSSIYRRLSFFYFLLLQILVKTFHGLQLGHSTASCAVISAGWEGVGGLMMLLDTVDQVVCTVGQTDGHSSPYYTTSWADVKWNRNGPQATLLIPLKGLIESIMVLCDLTGSTIGRL